MKKKFLTKIEDKIFIENRGVMIVPHLELPEECGFEPFSDKVLVSEPSGEERCVNVSFELQQHNLICGGFNCNIAIVLKDICKKDILIGSKIFVSDKTYRKLKG